MDTRRSTRSGAIAALVAGALIVPAAPAPAGVPIGDEGVVVSGLRNPRGITFDGSTMYVAEAGVGGDGVCHDGPEGEVRYGETGAIYRRIAATSVNDEVAGDRLLDGLPSLGGVDNPETEEMNEAGQGAMGPADVAVADDTVTFTIGLGADPAIRDEAPNEGDCAGGIDGAGNEDAFGTLHSYGPVTGDASLALIADIGDYETSDNPDGDVVDTNPFGLIADETDGHAVVDSGGNSLLHVASDGTVTTTTTFPPIWQLAPPFLMAPPGTRIPSHAVPTQVAANPDGGLDVGLLTGFPFQQGMADVVHVADDEDSTRSVLSGGFTNVMDVTWGPDGNLYVLEISHNGLLSGDMMGALYRVDATTGARELLRDDMFAPGGIAFGPDGRAYITVCSVCADVGPAGPGNGGEFTGAVIRYDAIAALPLVTVNDDTATTSEDEQVTVDVLSDDVAGNAGELTLTVLDSGHGSTTEGSIVYQPGANFSGTDTVIYQACDSDDHCALGELVVTVDETATDRIDGDTRIETAVEASRAGFPHGSTDVVIARSDDYPDALAAGVLAGVIGAPILLTSSDALSPATADEIDRLGATNAYVIGGTEAVSAATATAVNDRPGIATVQRLEGANRFETAVAIADEVEVRSPGVDHVYVVEGQDTDPNRGWPDALSVAYLAAAEARPILLVTTDTLPPATADALEGMDATIVGGPVAVSMEVQTAIDEIAGTVDRIQGTDRYETATEVAERADALEGLDAGRLFLASGGNWPDAIIAGPLVRVRGGVLLLVHPTDLERSAATESFIEDGKPFDDIDLLGGPNAISQEVEDDVAAAAAQPAA